VRLSLLVDSRYIQYFEGKVKYVPNDFLINSKSYVYLWLK